MKDGEREVLWVQYSHLPTKSEQVHVLDGYGSGASSGMVGDSISLLVRSQCASPERRKLGKRKQGRKGGSRPV